MSKKKGIKFIAVPAPKPVPKSVPKKVVEQVNRVENFQNRDVIENVMRGRLSIQQMLNKYNMDTASLLDIVMVGDDTAKTKFAQMYGVSKNNLQSILESTINRSDRVRLVLYSGTWDYGRTVNIEDTFRRSIENFHDEYVEISVRSKFKPYAVYTREYGLKQSRENIPYDMLTIKMIYGGKGHAVNIFKSGKVTFTGGYPDDAQDVKTVPTHIMNLLFKKQKKVNYKLNNITVQYESHLQTSLEDIRKVLGGAIAKQSTYFVEIIRGQKKIRIYKNGTIQISGLTTQEQVDIVPNLIDKIVDALEKSGLSKKRYRFQKIIQTRPQKRKAGEVAPDVMTRSTTCPIDKRPTPYRFSGTPIPGHYVGANPQGQPCCYRIPKKKSYLRPKIIERFKRLGIQIPKTTKDIFGIQLNNSALPSNVSGKEESELIFRNVVFYRGKEPKKNQAGNPVQAKYKNGRLKFSTKGKPIYELVQQEKRGFKIGSRLCSRYSMTRLIDIARRLGVALESRGKSSKGMSKDDVCKSIRKWALDHDKLKSQVNAINNSGNLRIGDRGRIASTYSKDELVMKARSLGFTINSSLPLKNMIGDLRSKIKSKESKFNTVFKESSPSGFKITYDNGTNKNFNLKTLNSTLYSNIKKRHLHSNSAAIKSAIAERVKRLQNRLRSNSRVVNLDEL